jgi:asparagine synthase (glutamine-hydrolysing)
MCGFVFYSGSDLDQKTFSEALEAIGHRGPDDTEILELSYATIGFKRLAIMDLTAHGNQPFSHDSFHMVCNGEIYNYKQIEDEFSDYPYDSKSDCEAIIPVYKRMGIEGVVKKVDAEYAFVGYESDTHTIVAARDPIGIRPMFYGFSRKSGKIAFASEVKALQVFCRDIKPFPPGYYFKDGDFVQYIDMGKVDKYRYDSLEEITTNIREKLSEGVRKRLQSDAPIGFLLSGGLDSSLVCSIAQKYSDKPIRTFAVGMSEDAIDLKYAKEVADYIGSDHTEVIITREDVIEALREVVYHLETWDITTVRASVGMYLVCKYIHEQTDIKVVLTGEVSDEIFGYKYTDFAPNALEFQKEAQKRVRELYMYDVLRADRCISAHSLEARVPFSDTDFVQYVMSVDPAKKMNIYGQGKYLLRKAFEEGDYLPESILYREKAAFSDAVGHSLADCIREYAAQLYSKEDVKYAYLKYEHATPFTQESLLYREIFSELFPLCDKLIKDFWMPNKEWDNCDVQDPSARVLPNYGASGV